MVCSLKPPPIVIVSHVSEASDTYQTLADQAVKIVLQGWIKWPTASL
jgi:dihydroxyacetone kinase DhaKLM complex PTS-EIIA-like component DhaM